jgi:hypothetical protein
MATSPLFKFCSPSFFLSFGLAPDDKTNLHVAEEEVAESPFLASQFPEITSTTLVEDEEHPNLRIK